MDVASETGHHKANTGSWLCVFMIIAGFIAGAVALPLASMPLWIVTAVLLVGGAAVGLASRIMEQAY
ncbi:hypothetical protein [Frankia sp. AgB32]|uniref:hypothetical protein n=1 Tax=Frankia sp. AgB32 TaxID=631119 RepID=UPI00200DD069|nr:hypothetical protein [Frankia sp. AgB32]MCK9893930.1 hypothetical protein [Frankia sp. AgB32]